MSFFGVTIAKGYDYNFPKIKGSEDFSAIVQAKKIEEELKELLIEIEEEDETAILMEAIDVIIATETLLRQHPRELVDAAANMVYMKNRVRDYWEFPIDDEDDDDKE